MSFVAAMSTFHVPCFKFYWIFLVVRVGVGFPETFSQCFASLLSLLFEFVLQGGGVGWGVSPCSCPFPNRLVLLVTCYLVLDRRVWRVERGQRNCLSGSASASALDCISGSRGLRGG